MLVNINLHQKAIRIVLVLILFQVSGTLSAQTD